VAIGIVVASEEVDPDTARARFRRAADRAGLSEIALATEIIGRLGNVDGPPPGAMNEGA
jgi:hypothetical protein